MAFREDAHIQKLRINRLMMLADGSALPWKEVMNNAKEMMRLDDDYTFETFKEIPIASTAASGGGAATGTGGDENLLGMGMNTFMYHILGTQTILSPVQHASGLNIGMDQADNDGVEITQGISSAAKHAFTVGTDAAFFFRCKFSIADVSGTDDCAIGFRKAEAYQANIDDYDEMAALNVISGNITIETILNAAATSATDTTDDWADAATHTLQVNVSNAGVVTFLIDGIAPTTTSAFTFDDAEVVVPFFYFLNASDVAGEVVIQEWEVGLQ